MSQDDCPKCAKLAPPWMATFADMAILLMAFFALLYSFTAVNIRERNYFAATIRAAFGAERKVVMDDIPMATSVLNQTYSPVIAERSPLAEPTNQVITPTRLYLEKYTKTKVGTIDIGQIQTSLRRTLAEEIINGEVKVKIEDDIVVIELHSLVTSGGAREDLGEKKGARVKQSAIDIAAKVLAVNSDNKVQVDFRARNLQTPDTDGAENIVEQDQDITKIQNALLEDISNGRLDVILKDDLLIVRLDSQDSFDSGQAELKPKTKLFLDKLGRVLNTTSGRIRVEGHTDNMPVMFSERFVSNWDLSAARAASVAAALITRSGILQSRMVVAGFADSKPLESNVTKEGRAKNRRIEIIVSAATQEEITSDE